MTTYEAKGGLLLHCSAVQQQPRRSAPFSFSKGGLRVFGQATTHTNTCGELCTRGIRSAVQHIIIHARRVGTTNTENGQEPLRDTAERCHEVEVAPGVQGSTWRVVARN